MRMVVEWKWGYGKICIQEIKKLGYWQDHIHFLKWSLIMIGIVSQKLNYSLECVNLSDLWHSTPVFLPGESHGQRSLVGYSPWGRKELDTTEWLTQTHQKRIFFKINLNKTLESLSCCSVENFSLNSSLKNSVFKVVLQV